MTEAAKDFSGQNLRGRSFKGQDLRGAKFIGADIRGADFNGANLTGTDFTRARAGSKPLTMFGYQLLAFILSAFMSSFVMALVVGLFQRLDGLWDKIAFPSFLVILIVFYVISYRSGMRRGLIFTLLVVELVLVFGLITEPALAGTVFLGFTFVFVFQFAFVVAVPGAVAGSIVAFVMFIALFTGVELIMGLVTGGLFMLANTLIILQALSGDEKQNLILKAFLAVTKLGGTCFRSTILTKANFNEAILQSADLRDAQLLRTCWQGAKKLLLARRTGTILEDYTVRALLESGTLPPNKSLVGKNLKGAYLAGFDLSGVDFTEADLSEADLRGANLTNANLTKVHAIGALFEGADLTGACIEDWNIDHTTQLEGVVCRYVYMLNGQRERQPSAGEFQEGQFAALYEKVFDTVNLIFTEKGIDWQAFTQVFGQMQVAYGEHGAELAVQAIERKSDGTFIVKVKVPPETDKAAIQQEFFREYENRLALLEAKYQAQLQAKNEVIAVYREQNARMDIIVNTLAQTNLSAKLAHKPITILFLAANPKGTEPLRLDEEVRAIDRALQQSKFRDKFELAQHWAVRVAELQSLLLRHEPAIVHFSGHGSSTGELLFDDGEMGESQTASLHAISRLFEVLRDKIRCVLLNACYTKAQAAEIAKHVPCVIGMSKAVGDGAAMQFAAAFYEALGYGQNLRKAFELGKVKINLVGLEEQDTPQLLTRRAGEDEIVLVKEGS